MPKDKKEYNRNYYASHTGIWRRNYAENADARRVAEKIFHIFQKISGKI